jgi:hypothetical protein
MTRDAITGVRKRIIVVLGVVKAGSEVPPTLLLL